jgi:hypothetical protein
MSEPAARPPGGDQHQQAQGGDQRQQPQGGYSQAPGGYSQQPPQGGYSPPLPHGGYDQRRPTQQGYLQHQQYAPRPQYQQRQPSEELTRDAEAALGARMELGPEYTEHIAAGLAERVEQLAAIRAGELRYQAEVASSDVREERSNRTRQFVLGLVSVVMGIPITGIAGEVSDPGVLGVGIAWAGIVGVNAVHAWSNRRRK